MFLLALGLYRRTSGTSCSGAGVSTGAGVVWAVCCNGSRLAYRGLRPAGRVGSGSRGSTRPVGRRAAGAGRIASRSSRVLRLPRYIVRRSSISSRIPMSLPETGRRPLETPPRLPPRFPPKLRRIPLYSFSMDLNSS